MSIRTYCRIAAVLAGLGVVSPGQAVWLRCVGGAELDQGSLRFLTTIADVGPVPAARLAELQKSLTKYFLGIHGDAHDATARCFTADDQVAASEHYSRSLNSEARKVGWANIVIIRPSEWLPSSESGSDMLHP